MNGYFVMSELIQVEQLFTRTDLPGQVILDCRFDLQAPNKGLEQYREGHIPGALYADLAEQLSGPCVPGQTGRHPLPSVEQWQATLRQWGIEPQSQVVVYDQGNGMFAARAWWLLKWAGIDKVQLLDGGLARWQQLGGDCTRLVPVPQPSEIQITPRADWTPKASTPLGASAPHNAAASSQAARLARRRSSRLPPWAGAARAARTCPRAAPARAAARRAGLASSAPRTTRRHLP